MAFSVPGSGATSNVTASATASWSTVYVGGVVAGDLVIAMLCVRNGSTQITGITSNEVSAGGTVWQLAGRYYNASPNDWVEIWWGIMGATGAMTAAFSASGATTLQSGVMARFQYGAGNTAAFDAASPGNHNLSSATADTGGGVASPAANALAIVGWVIDSAFTVGTAPAGYTGGIASFTSSRSVGYHKIKTDALAEDPQVVFSSGVEPWLGIMATFKEVAPGGGFIPRPLFVKQAVNRASTY